MCKLFTSKPFWHCFERARWFSSNNICLLQIFSHLPRNLFPCIAKLQSRLLPSTRPSGTPIFVNRAAQNSLEIYATQYWNICQMFFRQLTVRDESVVTEKPLSSDIWPAGKWVFKTQPLVKSVSFHGCVLIEHFLPWFLAALVFYSALICYAKSFYQKIIWNKLLHMTRHYERVY